MAVHDIPDGGGSVNQETQVAARHDDPQRGERRTAALGAMPADLPEILRRQIVEAWTGDAHTKGQALHDLAKLAVRALSEYVDWTRSPYHQKGRCPSCNPAGASGSVFDLCPEHLAQFEQWRDRDEAR